jgi:drug/metabolite transporter (DMT)-like permease
MLGSLAPVLFVLFWSTGFIVARGVVAHADVQFFLLWRFAAAAFLWGVAAVIAKSRWPSPPRVGQHLGVGALMMGLYLSLSFLAIAHGLPAGIMALLGALQPLFTAALILARGRGSPSVSTWWGLLIGFLGVILVLLPRLRGSHFELAGYANLEGLLAIAALTFGTLGQKRLAGDGLSIASCLQNLGAVLVAGLAFCMVGAVRWDGSPVLWGLLAWSVLITSVLAQGLLMWMMRRSDATHVTALLLLVPPVAASFAYLVFHETLTWLQLAGFALALAGVVLARRAAT